ncbi:MAG: hypothetical protein EA361_02855 [Bacteroidetes bacterium]|nr:MAG: hypothetical protein EA361_02855 [Bacteroidota bacterium]
MVRKTILYIICSLALIGCKADIDFPPGRDLPIPVTLKPTDETENGVNLIGKLKSGGWENNFSFVYGFIVQKAGWDDWGTDTIVLGRTNTALDFEFYYENLQFWDTKIFFRAFACHDANFYLANQEEAFLSGTSIEMVTPSIGVWQDTIKIVVKRLKDGIEQVVFDGSSQSGIDGVAEIIQVEGDTLTVKVPKKKQSNYNIHIRYKGNYLTKRDAFRIMSPEIDTVIPHLGFNGDTVKITGRYLGYSGTDFSNTRVFFGDNELPVLSAANTEVKVLISELETREEKQLSVRYVESTGVSPHKFSFISPWKLSNSNIPFYANGINFNLNGKMYYGITPHGNSFYSKLFRYEPDSGTLTHVSTFPIDTQHTTSFVVNNRAFVLTGNSFEIDRGKLFEFIPGNSPTWIERSRFSPLNQIMEGKTSFVISDRAFVLAGNPDNANEPNFYEYIPHSDAWIEAPQFPLSAMPFATSFVLDNMAYVLTGKVNGMMDNKVFRFDLNSNSWEQLADFPDPTEKASGFVLNGEAYAGFGWGSSYEKLYRYSPLTDQWNLAAIPPVYDSKLGEIIGVSEDKVHIGFPWTEKIYEFDPAFLKENYQHDK